MISKNWPPMSDMSSEIVILIDTLVKAEKRLHSLTEGEVDAVLDKEGRSFLFRRAQDELRQAEANRQAAIMDALPAHVALLDANGDITSVNDGWRSFARNNR